MEDNPANAACSREEPIGVRVRLILEQEEMAITKGRCRDVCASARWSAEATPKELPESASTLPTIHRLNGEPERPSGASALHRRHSAGSWRLESTHAMERRAAFV